MIKVLKAGLYDTIQDMGRRGYQQYGVPVSGVMDSYYAKIANALVGNTESEALLEMTLWGPKLEFQRDCLISITGADLTPMLNGVKVALNTAIFVKTGAQLSFDKRKYGCRAYLAVSGGFQERLVMNSRSMYKNITATVKIEKGTVLETLKTNIDKRTNAHASLKLDLEQMISPILDVYKGPEFEFLTKKEQEALMTRCFKVATKNSRMAYQLDDALENTLSPIITSLVLPGTVQLTPSGKLIVLMRDCQVTGGYPRVLQLTETAINRLSQKFTGDCVEFQMIESY